MTVGQRSLLERLLGLASATIPHVEVHADLAVPMRDGVALRVDRYVPATFGPSYWGLCLWAGADAAPDDLAAMTPVVTSAALVRSMFVGGAFAQQAWLAWSAVVAVLQDTGCRGGKSGWGTPTQTMRTGPGSTSRPWSPRSARRWRWSTGWHDLFLPWQLADWVALPGGIDKRPVIGPWTHEHPALAACAPA
jgi:uncharacterized protein